MPTPITLRNSGKRATVLSVLMALLVIGLGWLLWIRGQMILEQESLTWSEHVFFPMAILVVVLVAILMISFIQWDALQRRTAADTFLRQERAGLLQLALHRLGTPLTIFKWSLEILADCATGKNCPVEDVETHIQQMQQGIKSMDGIIRQLLEVDRLEGGQLHNDPKPTPVCPVIENIVAQLSEEMSGKKQEISLAACANETAVVDPELLRGILRELIHNASIYSPRGARISVSVSKHRNHVFLSVSDTGNGIPDSEIHRMFQKFGRGSKAYLWHPNGAGLGLYICKNVLEHVGGKIWMESTEGKGTTVSFTVPAK